MTGYNGVTQRKVLVTGTAGFIGLHLFTYVDDLVRGSRMFVESAPERPASGDEIEKGHSLSPVAPYRVVNTGNCEKVGLLDFIDAIKNVLGKKAISNYVPTQLVNLPATWAYADLLKKLTCYRPQTEYRDGIAYFVERHCEYYNV